MNKFTKYASLTVLSLVLFTSSVSANPLNDKLDSQKTQMQKDKSALQSVQALKQSIDTKIEGLDNSIITLMGQIDANKKQIIITQDEIKASGLQIQACQADLDKTRDLFQKRVRAMYINNANVYIEVLLNSNGISEFLSNLENVSKIIDHDKKIKKQLNDQLSELNKKKQDLNDQNAKLVALDADNNAKMAKLNEDKQSQLVLIAQLKTQEQALSSSVDQSQAQINETLKQIKAISDAAPRITPETLSRGAAPISSNNIIAYASNFMGTPYVWGGTTPNPGFDCSGFTQYVFAHFGVRIGRTTYEQINAGSAVSRSQLQPGDLVLFGSYSDPHHVGIYVGNGTYIHSPHTGASITVSSLDYRSDFVVGRRVQ